MLLTIISSRSFIEESQAGIKISPQDNSYAGISDRLVTVAGTIEEQMRAIDLILSKLSEDSYYIQSMSTPFPYAGMRLQIYIKYWPFFFNYINMILL